MITSQAPNLQPQLAEVPMTATLAQLHDSAQSMVNPQVMVNFVPGAAEFTMASDANFLTTMVKNLLDNAARFTTKGAINYGYEVYSDEIMVFVKDNGPGVDTGTASKIQAILDDPDAQVDLPGYGLRMSSAIAKALGAQMTFEYRRGCTFSIYLPILDSAAGFAAEAPAQSESKTPRNHDHLVLIAEDNDTNFILMVDILGSKYDIIHAKDGVEAVDMARSHKPDLILMDIGMPNMDGYEATSRIREFDQNIPIIAATAYAFVTDKQRMLASGFNSYISKPINPRLLEREMRNLLKQQ